MDMVGLVSSTAVVRCAAILVCCACHQVVFVNMVSVNVVQMAVVEIIDMVVVLDGRVAAIRAVDMGMPFMFTAGFSHGNSPICEVPTPRH